MSKNNKNHPDDHENHRDSNASPVTPVGASGALFSREYNFRSDSRMAARIISLGVVSEEVATECLRAGFMLAAHAATNRDIRGYSAAMSIVLKASELELVAMEKGSPGMVINNNVQTNVTVEEVIKGIQDDPDYLDYLRFKAIEDDSKSGTIREVCESGEVEDVPPPRPDRSGNNGHHKT